MTYQETTPYETEIIRSRMEEFLPAMVHFSSFAIHRYTIVTDAGNVYVQNQTNDNDDDGIPDGRWETWVDDYPTVEAALKHCGKCRVGISGVIVTVTYNGKEIR